MKDLATECIQKSLLDAENLEYGMSDTFFVEKRLIKPEEQQMGMKFHGPLTKLTETFFNVW